VQLTYQIEAADGMSIWQALELCPPGALAAHDEVFVMALGEMVILDDMEDRHLSWEVLSLTQRRKRVLCVWHVSLRGVEHCFVDDAGNINVMKMLEPGTAQEQLLTRLLVP
jgi:hypothetical protein